MPLPDVVATRAAYRDDIYRELREQLDEETVSIGELREAADGAEVLAFAATAVLDTADHVAIEAAQEARDLVDDLRVVLRKDVDTMLAAVLGAPVPAPDIYVVEVSSPATVIFFMKCPRCRIANTVAMTLDVELRTADARTGELVPKVKAKGRTHVCDQTTFETPAGSALGDLEAIAAIAEGQISLPVDEPLEDLDVADNVTPIGRGRKDAE